MTVDEMSVQEAPTKEGLKQGEDGKWRCGWGSADALYQAYHDNEWGKAVDNDRVLFEKICLEGFQAGLSWYTILKKRDNFRQAFDNFDFKKIAQYDEKDTARLLENAGIVRHKGKIEAVINNAKAIQAIIDEKGSFYAYVSAFKPQKPLHDHSYNTVRKLSVCDEATALSKDLKKRGFKFVGPTTVYAFMQAMGLVNDHVKGCHCL